MIALMKSTFKIKEKKIIQNCFLLYIIYTYIWMKQNLAMLPMFQMHDSTKCRVLVKQSP